MKNCKTIEPEQYRDLIYKIKCRDEVFVNFEKIREWARERGIYDNANSITQYTKLQEEAGELARGLLKEDKELIKDSIGDCVVVLTNLAEICGMTIEECIESAYNEIKNRKGKMNNGVFIKNE